MVVVVVVLAVLLVSALVALLVARRRLTATSGRADEAAAVAATRAEELAATMAARDEAAAAHAVAEAGRTEAEAAATAARQEAETATREADEHVAVAEAELAAARAEADVAALARADADARLTDFQHRTETAESARVAALGAADRAVSDAPSTSGDLDAQLMWALERSRTERTWRHSVAVDPTGSPFHDAGAALVEAIQVELDAAREEVGAEVDLDADLPQDVSAAGAVLTLRVVQELIADIVRRAETTTLRLRAEGTDLVVVVDAADEDGRPVAPAPLPIPPSDALEQTADGVRIHTT